MTSERPSGGEALMALIDDLSRRVQELEGRLAAMGEEVVTKRLRVQDGRHSPFVEINVEEGGDTDLATGKPLPPSAGVYVWGGGAAPGVWMEAAVGHPGRRSVGQVTVMGPKAEEVAVLNSDLKAECATFQRDGSGGVWVNTGRYHAEVTVMADDSDDAPAVKLSTSLEGITRMGRDLGDASVRVRHGDVTGVELGCHGPSGEEGSGFLEVQDGRIKMFVDTDDQATVDLLGSRGAVTLDAGPQGAAVAVCDRSSLRQILTVDGLGRP